MSRRKQTVAGQRALGVSALRAARKMGGGGWARHFLVVARFHFTEAARIAKGRAS